MQGGQRHPAQVDRGQGGDIQRQVRRGEAKNGPWGVIVEGEGAYTVGADTITFGPGNGSGLRQPVAMDPGEKYTYLGGNLTPPGQRVYITGEVPFLYTLRLG